MKMSKNIEKIEQNVKWIILSVMHKAPISVYKYAVKYSKINQCSFSNRPKQLSNMKFISEAIFVAFCCVAVSEKFGNFANG